MAKTSGWLRDAVQRPLLSVVLDACAPRALKPRLPRFQSVVQGRCLLVLAPYFPDEDNPRPYPRRDGRNSLGNLATMVYRMSTMLASRTLATWEQSW